MTKQLKKLKSESKENIRPLELGPKTTKRLIKAENKVKTKVESCPFKSLKDELD